MRQAAGLVAALALVLGAGARPTAQDVQIKVVVSKEIIDEIRRVIDVEVVRRIGREVGAAMRGVVVDLPWHDLPTMGGWQDRDFRAEQTDRETRTLALGASGSLELRNVRGPISVTAGSGRDVTVEVVRVSRGRTDADAKLGLQSVTTNLDHRGERATISARYPQARGRPNYSVSVGYNVTAPAGTHVTVGGYATDTTVKGITGDVAVDLVSGNINISAANRVSSAKTLSGKIWIADVDGDGNLNVVALSGHVTIERIKARQISVDAISGSITAHDIAVENAVLKSMNGPIEYAGTLSRTGRYELQTHNGPIRLVLSGSGGFDLEARTFSGHIKPDAGIELRNLKLSRTALWGTAGSGGATIVATTFSGDIVISRK